MDWDAYRKRMKWYTDARFGLFIHWGLYAVSARGEWVKSTEKMTDEQYDHYFREFNPKAYDPAAWAKKAKRAGMKYAVLTTKHHDGFCLWDTQLTDYKSTNTACGRDLVREFVDAFRAEGIRVGFYYSLLDWHHPDYPHMTDSIHPMSGNSNYPDDKRNFDRYLEYMHGQIRELCTNYGKVDLLWFDYSYDEKRGEFWKATELMKMVRGLQPDVIVDNRLEVSGEGFGSIVTQSPTAYSGDFVSPEQIIPPKGVVNDRGDPIPWESCLTMNNHWGYCRFDNDYKSSTVLIRKLVECVSKGGNMILNVGPDATGRFPKRAEEILEDIGDWMETNSDSIYGCGSADLGKPDYGRFTQRGNDLYLHVTEQLIGPIPVKGITADQVEFIHRLSDGVELGLSNEWCVKNYMDEYIFIYYGENGVGTFPLTDERDMVIHIRLKNTDNTI